MCGIVGYWNRDGQPAQENLIRAMMEPIHHRGPDDSGAWVGGDLGLGHVRLSILDLSKRGHQPFFTPDGQGVLVYNGEIYNFREIRDELESQGVAFTSTCDTEVLYHALRHWGPEMTIPQLNGMFGFAYYDIQERSLWLARDRLGIKPLYVASQGHRVVFASEVKALLAHPKVDGHPDMRALVMDVLDGRLDNQWTPFLGIRSVLPGTYWKITPGSTDHTVYFDPLRDLDVDRIVSAGGRDRQSYLSQFDETFANSVRIHLASDAPLATMCSGGLDSSLVTAMASKEMPNVVAYVADVKGISTAEGDNARRVGAHLGVEIRQVDVDLEDHLRLWPWAVWYGDQPGHHAHDTAFLAVARACHRDGIKVLLTGEGSDELFGGYGQQEDAYNAWRKLRVRHRFTPDMEPFRSWARAYPDWFPLNFRDRMEFPFQDGSVARNELMLRACALDGDRYLLGGEIFKKLAPVEPLEDRAFLARCVEHLYGHLQSLLHRNDRMGMGSSIESRVPFIENQLIDMGLHMPLGAKYYKGQEKWTVNTVGKSHLPQETTQAKKMGFQFNFQFIKPAAALLKGGAVADLLQWSASTQKTVIPRLANRGGRVAFKMFGLELWARMFLRGESPDELGEKLLASAGEAS